MRRCALLAAAPLALALRLCRWTSLPCDGTACPTIPGGFPILAADIPQAADINPAASRETITATALRQRLYTPVLTMRGRGKTLIGLAVVWLNRTI